ncbi:MAG: hypothetical protein WD069_06655 [Planctomycetales bacterium]
MRRPAIQVLLIAALLLAAGQGAAGLGRRHAPGDSPRPADGAPYIQFVEDVEVEKSDGLELGVEQPDEFALRQRVEWAVDDEVGPTRTFAYRSNCTRAPPATLS